MDKKLLDILVCPICKGPLIYQKSANELICKMASQKGGTTVSAKTQFVIKNGLFQSLDEIRETHPRAFAKWSDEEDKNLLEFHKNGKNIKEITELLQRSRGSIRARLEKFGITFD